jgi:hypothetical protein
MRKVLLISAGLVVTLSITTAILWRELRAERRVSADPHTQVVDATPVGRLVSAQPPPLSTTVPAPDMRTVGTPPVNSRIPVLRPAPGTNQGRNPLLDPEFRTARLAEQRLSLMRTLPGLVEELGLSEAEAQRFFDMLAESRVNRESASYGQPADPQEQILRQQELRVQEDQSIAALLGTKYAQWQQYQKTLPARMEANAMGTQLAQAGQPLSSAQQKSLATALIAEQERTRGERESLARSVNPADPRGMAQLQEQAMHLQEDSNRRILDAVGTSLDASQVETLRRQFEARLAMRRATSNLPRGR